MEKGEEVPQSRGELLFHIPEMREQALARLGVEERQGGLDEID